MTKTGEKLKFDGSTEISLWPEQMYRTPPVAEELAERSTIPGKQDRIVTGFIHSSIYEFIPEKRNGVSLLIVPGGAYKRIAIDKEGVAAAEYFSSIGICAYILKYRLPLPEYSCPSDVSLHDAVRAMRIIKKRAALRGDNPEKTAAVGFSAGGHIVSRLINSSESKMYDSIDAIDDYSCIPCAAALMYPVISLDYDIGHPGSREALLGDVPGDADIRRLSMQEHVSSRMPPVFICHAADDISVSVRNSLAYYEKCLERGANASLHLFHRGGHGFGLRLSPEYEASAWPILFERWLKENGVL